MRNPAKIPLRQSAASCGGSRPESESESEAESETETETETESESEREAECVNPNCLTAALPRSLSLGEKSVFVCFLILRTNVQNLRFFSQFFGC